MSTDFLSLLNESNSIRNDETGEIILTTPKLETDKNFIINSECKIISNCNTVISSPNFNVKSKSIYFKNISFETSLTIKNCSNFTMTDCNIKNIKYAYCLSFEKCESIELTKINITDSDALILIYFIQSKAKLKQIFANNNSTNAIIALIKDSTLQLSDSNLNNSQMKGINILNSSFEIENCTISNTVYPAIYAWDSKGKIINNQIKNTKMNGIVANNSNSIEIAHNNISDISGSAISVINDSKCEIHNNTIFNVNNNGIYVKNKSKINVYENELKNTKYPAIAILMKSKAKLVDNKISDIASCGIRIINAKKVEIDKNDINNIEECAISVLNTKNCIVENNTISNCHIAAVEVYNQSKVTIVDNNFSKIDQFAFIAYTLGEIKAENNTISNVGKSMANLMFNGGGEFINNKLENCQQQKEGLTCSNFYFKGNGNFSGVTNDELKKSDSIIFEEKEIENNNNLCIKCKKNDRKCFLLNCGHKIYCQECAEEAFNDHQKCPLCRLPIDGINEGFANEDETCHICCEKKADCIVIPCGHIGYCHKCLNKWLQDNQKCPHCQIEPVTYKNIQDI